jgi:hypothetical protein
MTPEQQAAVTELVGVLDRIDEWRRGEDALLVLRAETVQAVVRTGLGPRQVAEVLEGRLSEGSVKADLRRLPRG